MNIYFVCMLSCSVVSDSLQPHGLYPTRFLCLWDFPGKNTGVGCHFLLQGNLPELVSPELAGGFLTTKPPGKCTYKREAQNKRRGFKELTHKELARLKPTGQAGKLEFRWVDVKVLSLKSTCWKGKQTFYVAVWRQNCFCFRKSQSLLLRSSPD